MTFEEAMRAAAKRAHDAATRTMRAYAARHVTDEDDITGRLIGAIDVALSNSKKLGGLRWSGTIVRHRSGKAAEERRTGADMLIHVQLDTPTHRYSKGVLIQAKREEPGELMSIAGHQELVRQCKVMLDHTPSAFVFDYTKQGVRVGSAMKIAGASGRELYEECDWTSYRFFLELFRCPVGDREITSALVDDLRVPLALRLKASGEFSQPHRAI